jgi:hypothetical protein
VCKVNQFSQNNKTLLSEFTKTFQNLQKVQFQNIIICKNERNLLTLQTTKRKCKPLRKVKGKYKSLLGEKIVQPPYLQDGDKVTLISPAYWVRQGIITMSSSCT